MTPHLVLLSLLLAAPALAQQGVIAGTVLDATTQQPLGETRVTASSPSLQGEQVVTTDALGQFRMPQLPPGRYALRFEKTPFQPHTRSALLLRAERTLRVTAYLLPPGVTEANVIGTHPTIDASGPYGYLDPAQTHLVQVLAVRSTPRTVPVRPFESLTELAPRPVEDAYGISVGSGGSDDCIVLEGESRLAPEWFHGYTPVVRPSGEAHRLHAYPEELP